MMYTEMVIIILGVSLVLYTILGGADFGAGIIELFIGDKANSTVSRAMAPVWEANHMWLVIAVVILFNGFPKAYTILSTQLHIPVLLFLIAIVLRGTAFTFRHYDAYHDDSQTMYSGIFRYSSIFAVFFMGMTISGFIGGNLPVETQGSFLEIYVYSWMHWFGVFVGLFLVTLSAYIGAIFLLGEVTTEEGYQLIRKFCHRLLLVSIFLGMCIFISSYAEGLHFHIHFFNKTLSIVAGILATILAPYILYLIKQKEIWKMRWVTGAQILIILLGWFVVQWPNLVIFSDGSALTMYDAAAPTISMKILFYALAIGVVIIFPALFYLFRIFKSDVNLNSK